MMAIASCAVCIVGGIARLRFVTELLSKPIGYGYMNGIALASKLSSPPSLAAMRDEKLLSHPIRKSAMLARRCLPVPRPVAPSHNSA
jgi:MFS superfamily sulfate permease-like transporter